MKKVYLIPLTLAWLWGCNSSTDSGGGAHSHGPEPLRLTFWENGLEVFMEQDPLIVDQISQFAIHLTQLRDYKPLGGGTLTVSLVQNNRGIRNTAKMTREGIFVTQLKPSSSGYYQLVLTLDHPEYTSKMVLDSTYVYGPTETVDVAPVNSQGIAFSKEQSWKMNFSVEPVKYRDLSPAIRASGVILPNSEEEVAIAATAAGIVVYQDLRLVLGQQVKEGDWIATIKGDKITGGVDTEENLRTRYASAQAQLKQATADFERHKELFEAEIIPRSDYDQAEAAYYVAQSEFDAVASDYVDGGKRIYAPRSGYIDEILVEPGEYTRVGSTLIILSQVRNLRVRIDLPQKYYGQIDQISSIKFRCGSQEQLHSLEGLSGRRISYGKNLEETGPLIPVYFEIVNNGQLLSGSMVEAYVYLGSAQEILTLSTQAIMEDYGRHTVFVQTQGEEYEQREINVGQSDGVYSRVISGLKEGDRVVTQGAYQIKMASMAGSIGHGHAH